VVVIAAVQYPNRPPVVKFVTKLFHPNIYTDGAICFPERDTRVLTNQGFMFLEQIEAYHHRASQSDNIAPLLYACYDTASASLVYRPGQLVFAKSAPQHWVDFTDRSNNGSNMSLRVTPDHVMYAQVNSLAQAAAPASASSSPYRAIHARELAPGQECAHDSAVVRMLACAEAGVSSSSIRALAIGDTAVHSPVAALELKTEAQLDAFLQIYGQRHSTQLSPSTTREVARYCFVADACSLSFCMPLAFRLLAGQPQLDVRSDSHPPAVQRCGDQGVSLLSSGAGGPG
jgi:hypothetical protein